eukprot:CAMPEP_0116544840 /NCGR_PEP_ID=MMETSP0397-20121206/2334_1 /TAXON_ID=216820 /ORGANISM="Cyclophora tenuis, Strain ECT3854" /LENGTH=262 /DNA_ID=CAMNT_0004069083 /DNA_START=394 /DNA_END=1182 /DNA_ORIENTATION=+
MACVIAVYIVGATEGTTVVILSGIVLTAVAVVLVKRTWLRVGMILYCIGQWSLCSDSLGEADVEGSLVPMLLWNLLSVVVPLMFVASLTNDTTACCLVIMGLLYELWVLFLVVVLQFYFSLEELINALGHVLVLYLAVVGITATSYAVWFSCKVIDQPRQMSIVLVWKRVWPKLSCLWPNFCCKRNASRNTSSDPQEQSRTTSNKEEERGGRRRRRRRRRRRQHNRHRRRLHNDDDDYDDYDEEQYDDEYDYDDEEGPLLRA